MLPMKSPDDFVGESIRYLRPNTMDADMFHVYNSPFQTPATLRYSSSTDSTSPESYFITPGHLTQSTQYRPESDPISNDSQLGYRMVYDFFTNNDASLTFDNNLSIYNSNNNTNDNNLSFIEHQQFVNSPQKKYPVFESQNYDQNQACSTPVRLRAIVGRKIFDSDNTDTKSKNNIDSKIWQPKNNAPETVQRHYDLFPSIEHSFGISLTKKPTELSTNYMSSSSPLQSSSYLSQNTSPIMNYNSFFSAEQAPSTDRLQYIEKLSPKYKSPFDYKEGFTPNSLNIWFNNMSVTSNSTIPQFKTPYTPSSHTGSMSSQSGIINMTICTFCRKNGETASVYLDHCLKEKVRGKFKVTCPILRALVCETCGASGDDAHTITYCPVLRKFNNGKPLVSTNIALKSTRLKSDGTRRNK